MANASTILEEGGLAGASFEIHTFETNGTTAVECYTKLSSVLHCSITLNEDLGGTTASVFEYTVSGRVISVTQSTGTATVTASMLVIGYP